MTFEEWWAKQTTNFDPEEIGLMQLARVTWHAAQDVEREACAKVCENLTLMPEMRGYETTLCAIEIRMRSNSNSTTRPKT